MTATGKSRWDLKNREQSEKIYPRAMPLMITALREESPGSTGKNTG